MNIPLQCLGVARAALGEPAKTVGQEVFYGCPNPKHIDHHPSLQINAKKNVWLCGPCGTGGNAWQLAAFIAGLDPSDKPGVTAWLRERGLLDGSTNGSGTPRRAKRERKRVAEFYYSADLRKVRLEPGDNGKPKMFVWEHRGGDTWKPGDGGKLKPLYANKIFRDADQLDYAVGFEGEAKCDLAAELGIPGFSYKDMGESECQKLEGLKIYLWRDKDAAQKIHSFGHPRSIAIITPPQELPVGGDIVDVVKVLGLGDARIDELIHSAPDWKPQAVTSPIQPAQRVRAITRPFSEIAPQKLHWMWPGRIPRGKLTLLIGDPGLGKSLVTVDIISRSSRGTAFPDGSACEAGSVILLSAEDDPGDTIRPRLDAAGADVSRVHVLEAVRVPRSDGSLLEKSFNLETDIAALEDALNQLRDVRLIVIDPISAYLGAADSNTNAEVRGLLAPLAALAARYGVAILAVTHLRKSGGAAVHRAIASIAFVAAARAVWAVAPDPADPERRLMLPVKQNLAANAGGLAFRVEIQDGTARVEWQPGAVSLDANDVLGGSENGDGRGARKEAESFLSKLLADGPLSVKKIEKEAKDAGLHWITIRRAKDTLGILSGKDGFDDGWSWWLPHGEDAQHEDAQSMYSKKSAFEKVAVDRPDSNGCMHEDAQSVEMSTFAQMSTFDAHQPAEAGTGGKGEQNKTDPGEQEFLEGKL
jgi:putative DNA primase/helicase